MIKWNRVLFAAGVVAAVSVGCSDDGSSGTSNDSPTGGAATGGAATGGAATGGAATGGAATGGAAGEATGGAGGEATGGAGGEATGGTTGVSVECADGCAVLSAPFTSADQAARWQLWLSPTDASTETLTFRIYVKAGTEGGFQYGFQNGEPDYKGIYPWLNLAPAGGGWQDITIDLTQYAPAGGLGGEGSVTGPDSSKVQIINLWLASGDGAGPWANPTVVYVDSVKTSGGTIDYGFTSDVADLHANGDNLTGSSVTFTTIDP